VLRRVVGAAKGGWCCEAAMMQIICRHAPRAPRSHPPWSYRLRAAWPRGARFTTQFGGYRIQCNSGHEERDSGGIAFCSSECNRGHAERGVGMNRPCDGLGTDHGRHGSRPSRITAVTDHGRHGSRPSRITAVTESTVRCRAGVWCKDWCKEGCPLGHREQRPVSRSG
jgi:hypothetical protein